jgi:hypothetical protein
MVVDALFEVAYLVGELYTGGYKTYKMLQQTHFPEVLGKNLVSDKPKKIRRTIFKLSDTYPNNFILVNYMPSKYGDPQVEFFIDHAKRLGPYKFNKGEEETLVDTVLELQDEGVKIDLNDWWNFNELLQQQTGH